MNAVPPWWDPDTLPYWKAGSRKCCVCSIRISPFIPVSAHFQSRACRQMLCISQGWLWPPWCHHGKGPAALQSLPISHALVAAKASPPQAPLASLLGDFSTDGELHIHGFHFRSISAKLAGLLVCLLVLWAPSASEHLPFSNANIDLRSLQIQLLQPPVSGQ